jgi:hypothetical protein
MDNWNNHNTMMTRRDSKKPCCAPISGSLGCITWLQTVNPSEKVFMTIVIEVDQNRNYSERELCSSSFSEILIDQNGRRVSCYLPSIGLRMRLQQKRNNNKKVCQIEQSVLNVYEGYRRTIHQSCLHTTALISIASLKENYFAVVSLDERLK